MSSALKWLECQIDKLQSPRIRIKCTRIVTSVTTNVRATEEISIKVGLHQGLALSPFLFMGHVLFTYVKCFINGPCFITISECWFSHWFSEANFDVIFEDMEKKALWTMLFADDLVICEREKIWIEERLEKWCKHLDDVGRKVSCKTCIYHWMRSERKTLINKTKSKRICSVRK